MYSAKPYDIKYLHKANQKGLTFNFVEESLSLETICKAEGSQAISVFTNDDVSDVILDKAFALGIRFIATRSAGHDHINLSKAESLGIAVANVPDYSPYSIAEHAIALMLSLNRKLIKADQKVKNYNFLLDDLIGFDLHGKTVGIIGTGKIGGIVSKILNGFGCNIVAYDLFPNEDYVRKYGVKYVDLDTLYAASDIITLHCPSNKHTKHLISDEAIKKMKKGVMIINTGRGAVIDTKALIKGLEDGKIGYAGLDVYENEKGLFFYNHENKIMTDELFARLLSFKNVLVTGHQAFLTVEALKNIADATVYNLKSFSENIRGKNELTQNLVFNTEGLKMN